MVEQYVTTWLAKHSAAIEDAAQRCPDGGWELQEARDETVKILGLWDEWLDFCQRVDLAHVRHERKYPAQWSRARKSRTDLSGSTLTRAAHESDDPEMKSDFLKLHEEYENFNRKFLGMFRSLLKSDIWYAMGSVDRDLAERKKVFPDAWDRLQIRSWYIDRISEPDAKGLAGIGHLHGVRIFPTISNKAPHDDREMLRWNAAQVVAFIISKWGDGNPLPRAKAAVRTKQIADFNAWVIERKNGNEPVPPLPDSGTLEKEYSSQSRPWNQAGWRTMTVREISESKFSAI